MVLVDGMQISRDNFYSKDPTRPFVIRSLRKSSVRKKILEYLYDISPSSSYTSEIAYNVKTTSTNVIGAIRGMGARYKEEESLEYLKIVEKVDSNTNIKLYKISDFGKEIIESLKR